MTEANVLLDHGSGGLLSNQLIENVIVAGLGDAHAGSLEDSTLLQLSGTTVAMTTDSFIVEPIFFSGGDIGKLAVCGTVNDLAVSGATPRFLTLALVLEEGFPLEDLRRVIDSIREAATEAGVRVVAGDTKVLGKGDLDRIVINTTGLGVVEHAVAPPTLKRIAIGDRIVVSGPVGNHGVQILSRREGLGFEASVVSDCAPLGEMIRLARNAVGDAIHCMRDLTRGGLAGILNEIASNRGVSIDLDGQVIPVQHETRMACSMLGISPMYLANEGCVAFFVRPDACEQLLVALLDTKYGKGAVQIGTVVDRKEGAAPVVEFGAGGKRSVLGPLVGRVLPRLC